MENYFIIILGLLESKIYNNIPYDDKKIILLNLWEIINTLGKIIPNYNYNPQF